MLTCRHNSCAVVFQQAGRCSSGHTSTTATPMRGVSSISPAPQLKGVVVVEVVVVTVVTVVVDCVVVVDVQYEEDDGSSNQHGPVVVVVVSVVAVVTVVDDVQLGGSVCQHGSVVVVVDVAVVVVVFVTVDVVDVPVDVVVVTDVVVTGVHRRNGFEKSTTEPASNSRCLLLHSHPSATMARGMLIVEQARTFCRNTLRAYRGCKIAR